MTPERWQQVEELFHAARERGPGALAGVDYELRLEVESLLAQDSSQSNELDHSPWPANADETVTSANADAIASGLQIGHYKIQSKLGEGGMGTVYKALDTKLNRPVAIKFLSDELANPTARRRFQREAQMASSLNHPHILTVFDVGELGARQYIVTEFVDGGTLGDWIKGKRTWRQVLELLTGIADALATAHAAGILHRDIKPANILVARNGYAKLADFGLAKLAESKEDATQTLTEKRTQSGAILGTPAYMSPEQASARPLDDRSDIFSFGVVLYEMLSGRRPFSGSSHIELLHRLIQSPPEPLPTTLPATVRMIVEKALEKDPAERYQSMRDMVVDLKRAVRQTEEVTPLVGAPMEPVEQQGVQQVNQKHPNLRRGRPIAAGVVVAAVLAGTLYYFRSSPAPPKLTEKDTLVLADFKNSTGDSVFDDTLRQGLSTQLSQSPLLSLLPDERISETLKQMGQPPGAGLTPEIAKEVCERTNSAAVLEGSIARVGTQYAIGLRARDCNSGKLLDEEQTQAAGKEEVLSALDTVARQFRTRVGESLATVRQHDVPIEEATTSSFEALKAYTMAMRLNITQSYAASIPHYQRAIELDPNFAMAHAHLSLAYYNANEIALARESASKAFGLRQRVSEHEQYAIKFMYYRNSLGNLGKAWETVQAWAQAYPRDSTAQGLCGGFSATGTGHFLEVIEHSRISATLDPGIRYNDLNIIQANINLERLKEAEEVAEAAFRKMPQSGDLVVLRYLLAFLRNDEVAMRQLLAESKGTAGAEDLMTHLASLAFASRGRLREADELWHRAVDAAKFSGKPERAALFMGGAATSHALLGDATGAKTWAAEALKLSTGRDASFAAAFALEIVGGSPRSGQIADDLNKRFPEDTSVQDNYLPTLRALFAKADPAKALASLQAALPNELGVPAIAFTGWYGAMYPAYVRGQVYLQLKQ
ncbi:MAG: protein kinase, partial [Acidobacteriota bacterium]